jgi:transcriptional regulator with XRE-family HTH domain
MRGGAFDPPALPSEFWHRPEVKSALTARDIGALFRLLRDKAGLSQFRIGTAVEMSQGRISYIINGKQTVTSLQVLARIADGLGMPSSACALLGVASSPVIAAGTPARKRSTDDQASSPRPHPGTEYPDTTDNAISAITGLWANDAGHAHELMTSALDPAAWNAAALAWLVGQPDRLQEPRPAGRRVGRTDVVRVRETAKLFAELDNRFGGAHPRRALIHYLREDAAELLKGQYTDQVGRELFSTIAEAVLLTAWASYDCGLHGIAQRYYIQALRLAEAGDDQRLACSILSAMSHQATYLGHLSEAVHLARAAQTGSQTIATPTMTAQFQSMEARALARIGDSHACQAILAAAEATFARRNPTDDPEFISYFDEAEMSDEFGHCFRDLGLAKPAAQHAANATASYGDQYQRSDFFALMVLADAYADHNEPEQACQAALKAMQLGETLTSARCALYVTEFRRRLDRYSRTPAVREFTEQAAGLRLWANAA